MSITIKVNKNTVETSDGKNVIVHEKVLTAPLGAYLTAHHNQVWKNKIYLGKKFLIVIHSDGKKKVRVEIFHKDNLLSAGTATCNLKVGDEFNLETGEDLALLRALEKMGDTKFSREIKIRLDNF